MRLPRIAPTAPPADALPCSRAKIGMPRPRSIRAPSAFIVASSEPAKTPKAISEANKARAVDDDNRTARTGPIASNDPMRVRLTVKFLAATTALDMAAR
jgi:hypothetical protein